MSDNASRRSYCEKCDEPAHECRCLVPDWTMEDERKAILMSDNDAGGSEHIGQPKCRTCGTPPKIKVGGEDVVAACACTELFVEELTAVEQWDRHPPHTGGGGKGGGNP